MKQVTPIRDLKGYLEPEQVEKVIAVAANPRDVLLVRIPWRTGIRVSELTGINVSDIDYERRGVIIKVQKMRKRDGKTIERRRVVPIDQGTLEMVREYLEWRKQFPYKGDLLFPITRQRVGQIYWKLGRRAGIGLYVVSESGTMWVFEVTDTLEATALLPGGSIIVPSYL